MCFGLSVYETNFSETNRYVATELIHTAASKRGGNENHPIEMNRPNQSGAGEILERGSWSNGSCVTLAMWGSSNRESPEPPLFIWHISSP